MATRLARKNVTAKVPRLRFATACGVCVLITRFLPRLASFVLSKGPVRLRRGPIATAATAVSFGPWHRTPQHSADSWHLEIGRFRLSDGDQAAIFFPLRSETGRDLALRSCRGASRFWPIARRPRLRR